LSPAGSMTSRPNAACANSKRRHERSSAAHSDRRRLAPLKSVALCPSASPVVVPPTSSLPCLLRNAPARPGNTRDVPVIGATTAAKHVDVREAFSKRCVLLAKLLRITDVEFGRVVELLMAA